MLHVLMLVHSALSAGTYIAGKRALAEVSPVELAMVRFVLAAVVHAVLLARMSVRFERRDLLGLAALGVLAVAVNQLLFLAGLALSTPGHAALLYAMTPIFVFIVEWLRGRERASRHKVFGIAVAFAGTVVVLAGRGVLGMAGARDVLLGDLLLLLAVIAWAVYAVGGKAYAARYGGLATGSVTLVAGTVLCAPAGAAFVHLDRFVRMSPLGVASVVYLVVVTSVVAWLIYYWALGRAEASRVAIWSNLQPVLTALLAWAMYGEALTAPFVAGGAMVVAGVVLAERR
ncbi:MAG TPA: DMT family transporter [Anaeromyxobacter sp.]